MIISEQMPFFCCWTATKTISEWTKYCSVFTVTLKYKIHTCRHHKILYTVSLFWGCSCVIHNTQVYKPHSVCCFAHPLISEVWGFNPQVMCQNTIFLIHIIISAVPPNLFFSENKAMVFFFLPHNNILFSCLHFILLL